MIRNYFKIAWRHLIKNKAYSGINILGLAIGMAVALLIGMWISDEVSFNKNFTNYDRVVRVMINSTHGNDTRTMPTMPIPLSGELRTRYAEDFKKVTMASWNFPTIMAVGEKTISQGGIYVQPEFMQMFSIPMISGTWASLNDPSSIVISQSLATSLFGKEDPMNKEIRMGNKSNLKVTGVYRDFPDNSELREDNFLAPWDFYKADQAWVKGSELAWNNNSFQIYAQLQDHADLDKVNIKIKAALAGHDRKDKPEVLLHPMSKWHLYNEFTGGRNTGGNIQFVWMFGIIGLFVLLLACINFMNLSTARSEKRAREVGIRKAVGSLRGQLILQFLGESLLIVVIAFALALLLAGMALPFFNHLADKQMGMLWSSPGFWLLSAAFVLFTGLVSGSYPAFYLSSFSSVKVLKGEFKAGRFAAVPRKVLIVLQFTVSVSLIIGTLIVLQQIQFARNRPVGYNREGLITVMMNTPDLFGHYDVMRNDLIKSGAAVNMAEGNSPTTQVWSNQSGFDWKGKDPNLNPSFAVVKTTHDLGKTLGWQFAAGRDFSREFGSDSAAMILNEAAVKYMGLKDPVGETVKYLYSDRKDQNYRIVGVIHDMLMQSPFEPVKPTIIMIDYSNVAVITVRLNPAMSAGEALPKIAGVFKKYNPGAPFDYTFNDEDYAKKFRSEERIGNLAVFFAVFAVFISCLGLFGLASFMAEQRNKEIGVRKILGASVFQLWGLLSKDFLRLVFLSFFIAIPLSYYVMHGWLQRYNYRIAISAWVFVITMLTALLITLVTVSFQSIRASLANPVKSLRTE
ncbi:MAG TPA: ABC transporter permease [Puia sp.]|nr:ABC transporter permease [Puia sp.]